jgi:hypothetical protein
MKLSKLTKPFWATAIALGVGAISVLPASAQTGTGTAPTTTAPGTTTTTDPVVTDTTTPVERNDGFDWGWLGLLGLIGLAGLTRKSDDRQAYRDPNIDATRTTTRTTDYNR